MTEKKHTTVTHKLDSVEAEPSSPETAPTPRPGGDPFVGKTVGNCVILEKINEGGTAHIYRARNETFHLDRVVKVLKPSLIDEQDFFARFSREAQLTARLDHPNILRVYDTGEVDGYFYIEMEHIAGQTLRTYLQSAPRIAEKDILHIASQVAKALDYAHNVKITAPDGSVIHGILHRDIKPENIMITPARTVKLMDFGAAKPLNITSDTMQGMIVGTFHYMSPEQIDGLDLDVRSDFFSLGIVMYELYTGQKPFAGRNLTTLIRAIKKCEHPSLRKSRPSISPLSEELIERLLSRPPDHRPSSAREIDESIQICLQSLMAWGAGRRVRVPFSFKRAYPTISLVLSVAALLLSSLAYVRSHRPVAAPQATVEPPVLLLEKGREVEQRGEWKEAVTLYELVRSVKDGGVANEYLEAQIRLAYICYKHLNQFTRARSVLERLRMQYSDPAIDAYLGEIYFKLALYTEARDRLDAALNTSKGSVILQSGEYKNSLLHYYAHSLDKQYVYVDQDPGLLREAIKAWNYYIEFAGCSGKSNDDCGFAAKRLAELEKLDKKPDR